jgi:hypothetical protein
MVGFAGRVTPTPRKTRFRLLVRLYRTGLDTRKIPTKGFKLTSCSPSSLPKLSWRKDILLIQKSRMSPLSPIAIRGSFNVLEVLQLLNHCREPRFLEISVSKGDEILA